MLIQINDIAPFNSHYLLQKNKLKLILKEVKVQKKFFFGWAKNLIFIVNCKTGCMHI